MTKRRTATTAALAVALSAALSATMSGAPSAASTAARSVGSTTSASSALASARPAATTKPAPTKAAPKTAAAKTAAAKKTASTKSTPKKSTAKKTAPKKTTPKKTTPTKTTPTTATRAVATTVARAKGPKVKPAKRTVVWRDDFTGPAGSGVDARYWNQQEGGYGWGNEELQYYTTGTDNAALDGAGRLVISAKPDDGSRDCWYGPCTYTSARLTTEGKVTATSGRVEARIKVPHGAGLWPAFWMLGDNIRTAGYPQCGELDIMEFVGSWPDEVWSSVHGPGYVRAGLTGAARLAPGRSYAEDFHVYAMDWTPDGLEFSVDGQVNLRVARADIGAGNEWVFDKPMHLVLNLAVGGSWPGTPPPETTFPAQLLVDYVALYR